MASRRDGHRHQRIRPQRAGLEGLRPNAASPLTLVGASSASDRADEAVQQLVVEGEDVERTDAAVEMKIASSRPWHALGSRRRAGCQRCEADVRAAARGGFTQPRCDIFAARVDHCTGPLAKTRTARHRVGTAITCPSLRGELPPRLANLAVAPIPHV